MITPNSLEYFFLIQNELQGQNTLEDGEENQPRIRILWWPLELIWPLTDFLFKNGTRSISFEFRFDLHHLAVKLYINPQYLLRYKDGLTN